MADRSATMHIRSDLAAQLEELARALGRSASELTEEALVAYLHGQRRAGEHIRERLRQAEAGDLIPNEEVWARLDDRLARRLGERADVGRPRFGFYSYQSGRLRPLGRVRGWRASPTLLRAAAGEEDQRMHGERTQEPMPRAHVTARGRRRPMVRQRDRAGRRRGRPLANPNEP